MSTNPPMRCGDAAPYLPTFADGELAEPMRSQVAEHVAGCANCAREVRRYRAIDQLVATLPKSSPSPVVLDRVLAATRRDAAEPAVRESLHGRRRPRARPLATRALPDFLTREVQGTNIRPLSRLARRPTGAARVLPVLAAVLLITLAILAFNRLPAAGIFPNANQSTTPRTAANVLAQTSQEVAAKATHLPFTPLLPRYLPAGAQLQNVYIDTSGVGAPFLQVSWILPYPLTVLHLRESSLMLLQRGDYLPDGPSRPDRTWSLGQYQWTSGASRIATGNAQHWAVGEDRSGALSITLDVGAQPDAAASDVSSAQDKATNVLRLTSLSIDAPYQPLTVQPPDTTQNVLHFVAREQTAQGLMTWEVYSDPTQHVQRVTAARNGATVYTDVVTASAALRLDPAARTYQSLPSAAVAGEPLALRDDAATFLLSVNSYLANGELWNMGLGKQGGARVYQLVLVGAPYPTEVYVDAGSRRVVGAEVNYSADFAPGTPSASSHLTPLSACPSYTLIQYLSPSDASIPADVFATQPPSKYAQSANMPATLGCSG
ncbi:MAG: hypothetical protein OJF49_001196 [Ktedonobacterales bacterium]|jgi:anti-sigma factor RsiW|nr:MAG: hypothetical protein OJF49_001196 [Ktedonobacterales bacterium]